MTLADTVDALIEPCVWLGLIACVWLTCDFIYGKK